MNAIVSFRKEGGYGENVKVNGKIALLDLAAADAIAAELLKRGIVVMAKAERASSFENRKGARCTYAVAAIALGIDK